METTTDEPIKIGDVISEEKFMGKWKLHYEVENRAGVAAFGGYTLAPYVHPLNQRMCYPVLNGQRMDYLPFNKIDTFLSPFDNLNDKQTVAWLLTHPDVKLPGLSLEEKVKNNKNNSTNISLVNLDQQSLNEIKDENTIDYIIATITLPGTNPAGLSLEKVRWVCARAGAQFRDRKYITNPEVENKLLRKKLKDYVRKSVDNANNIEKILNDLQKAKSTYIIKILLEKNVLTVHDGIIKYEQYVLGSDIDSVIGHMAIDSELAIKLEASAQEEIREELKKSR